MPKFLNFLQYMYMYNILYIYTDLGVLMGVCLPEGEAFKTGI